MKKYLVRFVLIVFIMFTIYILSVLINNSPRMIAYKNNIVNVDSIYHSPPGLGPSYTTVIGENKSGDEVGIWIRDNYVFNRKLVYKEYLKNGITEDIVFNLINEKNLLNTSKLPIICFISSDAKYMYEDSIYWIVTDEHNSFNEEYLIVNFYTGEIVDIGE